MRWRRSGGPANGSRLRPASRARHGDLPASRAVTAAGSSPRPSRPTVRPARAVIRRSRGSRCCDWPKVGSMRPRRRSAPRWTRRRTGLRGPRCWPRTPRSCLGQMTSRRRGPRPRRCRGSPSTSGCRSCMRCPPMPRAPSSWPRAIPEPPSPRCAGRGPPGRRSGRPTRPRVPACSSGLPTGRWVTPIPPSWSWSWTRRARSSDSWAPRRRSPGWRRSHGGTR
jgi:hypothetical protein